MNCPYCGEPAMLKTGADLFPNRPIIARKKFYTCEPCDARVGCHDETEVALGTMANPELRRARRKAHQLMDALIGALSMRTTMKKYQARGKVYEMISHKMSLPVEKCHVGSFDLTQCYQVNQYLKSKIQEADDVQGS